MSDFLNVLVASSDLENRNSLLHILDKLSLNVISCSALSQAKEVLSRQEVSLVFCDESLNDGCYRELLLIFRARQRALRFVVTIRRGEWDEYLEAMRLGAFDAIRWPVQPTDVELIILRAMREDREAMTPQQMIA
jgi:DNA-binding NtrC family response regulator